MKYPSISVQIICKNEERVIERCLKAISNQLTDDDEIIVVDTGSIDRTKEIIKRNFPNIRLFSYIWEDNFANARNYGLLQTKKDWIFCIDSDEVLQPNSLKNLCDSITMAESITKEPIVFCPKVLNEDDTIVYNAGRIIKNNGMFKFYGCVHEYPIYIEELTGENYDTIRLTNVVMFHDGYNEEIVEDKGKALRNSVLDKKMIDEFPNSDRYYYFYYRDAKSILSDEVYENGLKKFLVLFPTSKFLTQVYSDLIRYLIAKSQTDEAEIYLQKYWEIIKSEDEMSDIDVIRLSILNELQKISVLQANLLQILLRVKSNLHKDENRLIENGYMLDDIIGFLHWGLGDGETAKDIYLTLKKIKYVGMLNKLFEHQE